MTAHETLKNDPIDFALKQLEVLAKRQTSLSKKYRSQTLDKHLNLVPVNTNSQQSKSNIKPKTTLLV